MVIYKPFLDYLHTHEKSFAEESSELIKGKPGTAQVGADRKAPNTWIPSLFWVRVLSQFFSSEKVLVT